MAKGRPRKIGVKRTKSGQISRAADAQTDNADPIKIRMRLFGLSEADARDQKAETYIGRLCMAGRKNNADGITQVQYDAAQEYLSAYESFQRAVKSPDALRSPAGGGNGAESDGYANWCRNAVQRYENAFKAVREAQEVHRGANMYAAIDYLVVRNEQHPHMVGDCRLALNALAHHFGLMGKRKAA